MIRRALCRVPPVAGMLALLLLALPGAAPIGLSATQATGVPILVYHRFDPTAAGPTTVTTRAFLAQLQWLAAHQRRVVPLRMLLAFLGGKADAPSPLAVAVTADDGHRSIYTDLYPLILKYRLPVTLFIYPSAISHASYALTWEQIAEMQRSGLVDIQSHTYWHPDFRRERARRTAADYQKFVAFQLVASKRRLEERLGGTVDLLAWPYGIHDPDLELAAARAGYIAAFGFGGGEARSGTDLFAIPRIIVGDRDRGAAFGALLERPQMRREAP